jgi:hypothetical protein
MGRPTMAKMMVRACYETSSWTCNNRMAQCQGWCRTNTGRRHAAFDQACDMKNHRYGCCFLLIRHAYQAAASFSSDTLGCCFPEFSLIVWHVQIQHHIFHKPDMSHKREHSPAHHGRQPSAALPTTVANISAALIKL